MEFRCRLGTPGGEIIEGVYIADTEARLRRELEEKGLYVLGLQRAGGTGSAASRCRGARGSRRASSSSSTRSWRRCSRRHAAGPVARHPAASRHQSVFKAVLDDVTSGCGRERAVGGVRGARRAVPGRLHGVAAGGREERQPRAGDPALRRVREGRRQRQAEDDLGAGLSGHPAGAGDRRRVDHRPAGGAGVRRRSTAVRAELPLSTRVIVRSRTFARELLPARWRSSSALAGGRRSGRG